jgi:putative FmdB family regulatory protein
MPTYEYECRKCGEAFEYFQRMSDPPMSVCEKCGGQLAKLVSAGSGLIFKGSGFYITDYKKSGEPSESSKDGSKSAKSGDSSPKESSEKKDKPEKPKAPETKSE